MNTCGFTDISAESHPAPCLNYYRHTVFATQVQHSDAWWVIRQLEQQWGWPSHSFTFSGPSSGKNLLHLTSGIHKSRAYGRPEDWISYGGAKYLHHNYHRFFLTHRNAYQLTCDVQKAPDNTEVHLTTPELWELGTELLHIALLTPRNWIYIYIYIRYSSP